MIRMASEDIGLADPRALPLTLDAVETYERLGHARRRAGARRGRDLSRLRAEVERGLRRPTARRARSSREDGSRPVPLRLRNAPTKLMKELGYGKGYRYAHDEEDAYAAGERYFPDDMPDGLVVRADRSRARSEDPRQARDTAREGPRQGARDDES